MYLYSDLDPLSAIVRPKLTFLSHFEKMRIPVIEVNLNPLKGNILDLFIESSSIIHRNDKKKFTEINGYIPSSFIIIRNWN